MTPDAMCRVRLTRRRGLLILATVLGGVGAALAQDELRVTIPVDRSEIITSDLRRLRLAEPAEVVFAITGAEQFRQLYPGDPAAALTLLELTVLSAARRIFGPMTAAGVLRGDGEPAFVAQVDRDAGHVHVALRRHTLRYEPVPPP